MTPVIMNLSRPWKGFIKTATIPLELEGTLGDQRPDYKTTRLILKVQARKASNPFILRFPGQRNFTTVSNLPRQYLVRSHQCHENTPGISVGSKPPKPRGTYLPSQKASLSPRNSTNSSEVERANCEVVVFALPFEPVPLCFKYLRGIITQCVG